MIPADGFWYLASPYTRYTDGVEAAAQLAAGNAAILLEAGVPVFSPIAHTHPIHLTGLLTRNDHDFWIKVVDGPMIRAAAGLIFLEADGWQNSKGMHEELVEFTKAGKPIVFMQPGIVPAEVLPKSSILGAPTQNVIIPDLSKAPEVPDVSSLDVLETVLMQALPPDRWEEAISALHFWSATGFDRQIVTRAIILGLTDDQ